VLLGVLVSPASAATPPTAPGSVATSAVTSSSVTLTWTEAADDAGVVGYRVYRGPATAADSALTLIWTTDPNVLRFVASNLRAGYGYRFQVAAIDADGNETRGTSVTATTPRSSDTTAPSAPSSTSVLLTAFSSSRIDVAWAASASTDVAYYEVLRGSTVVAQLDRPLATKFSDNGLAASTTYSYSVRAVDSAGNRSALTTAKSKATLAAGTVTIPRGPYTVKVTGTSAVVVWWTNIPSTGRVTVGGASFSDATTSTTHKVTVTGLKAGTAYTYTVSSGGASSSGSLHTAAAAGSAFTFAVIGDYGSGSPQEAQNATRIAGSGSQFLQTVGDNVYPSAGFPDPNFATWYSDLDSRFFKQMGSVLKTQAFFPANGNKDYYAAGEFWNAFPYPATSGAPANSYYSYDWGPAHITVLDPFRPFAPGSAQYTWAQADLTAHQSSAWRIVVEHAPPYSSTNTASGLIEKYLVPLFEAQHVNLVLSGDVHNYQRSKPLRGGVPVTSGGVTYVITGGGGNGLNSFSTSTMPSWEAFRSATYESLKIQVSPTALQLTAVAASDGSVLDSASIPH
jgi:hypothetical protein